MERHWGRVPKSKPRANSRCQIRITSTTLMDRKFMFNTFLVYEPPFYKSQHGIIGHIAGGWTFAPILSVGSGLPLEVSPTDANDNQVYGGGQAFGEGEGLDFAALQNAIRICPNNFGS